MATSLQTHLVEYLQTTYSPDREYVDGEVLERHVGKFEHARIQALLAIWFGSRERLWNLMVVTEQRIQVAPTRVRIPDVALVAIGSHPEILLDPPILAIEILSPDDTYSDTQRRAEDYKRMGISNLWIIDPETRTGRMCSGDSWTESTRLEVQGTAIYIDLPALFESIEHAF